MATQGGGNVRSITSDKTAKKTTNAGLMDRLKKVAKIDRLPKNVRQSIPFQGIMSNGIIETTPGTFTKTYMLQDINFTIAPDDEQLVIFQHFIDMLNSFNENVQWEITTFKHEIEKKRTIQEIRLLPQKDGLNKYRQEMNGMLLDNLKKGNNSAKKDKMITISIHDSDAKHAAMQFNNIDTLISQKIRRITGYDTTPMTSQDRIKLLYNIYNQDSDYRLATSIYDNKEVFNLPYLEKCGLSIKDLVGPSSMDFSPGGRKDMFMLGDTYAQALYLERIPSYLNTNFMADLEDISANMLISSYFETIDAASAGKLVKEQLAAIEANVASVSKRNAESGYFGVLPPDLEKSQESVRSLMNDITSRDQNIFYVTFIIVAFARTKEELLETVKLIKDTADKHMCAIKPMKFQQEFAFNTALPLCRNDVFVDRLYTTESAGIFIPFNSQEIMQKNAIFYGLNQVSKSMILYDRTTGDNYNGLIFGYSGSGKSFAAKNEMVSVLLSKPNAQVFVIDPQGEYRRLVTALHGEEIYLSPGSSSYINPLDLDISTDKEDEIDPITMKSDFIISLFSIIVGKNRSLSPIHTSLIDKCVRKIYRSYIDELAKTGMTCDITKCPTLSDLYQELDMLKNEHFEAGQLADILAQYAVGSFDTFAHRTNIETNSRFVVYNTKQLGHGMRELGLHICINDIWNRMIANSKRDVYTWFYIDEFHILLESEGSTLFLKRIWKMARKWFGVPTGIMQNTEDLLRNEDTRAIFNNTSFILMLKEPMMDRQNLQLLLNLSVSQLEYITESDKGCGLLYNGKVTIPFMNKFSKNTELYKAMTTSHDENATADKE
ncbi:MAG: DUF87 domain-containing protein [Lachnospiraceae bacterium]|nr:DUF87 domain-containing protein [Lachnospiraceae bacterium]